MNNEFNLIRLLGIMTLSIGVMFIATGPQLAKYPNELYQEQGFIFVLGIPYFLIGMSMLFRKPWSRIAGSILFALSIFFVLFYVLFMEPLPSTDLALYCSLVLMVCTLLFCGILFLNNEKIIAEYNRKTTSSFDESNILDADL